MIDNYIYLQLQKIIISISSLKYIDPRTFDGSNRLRKLEISSHSLQNTPDLTSVGRTLQIFRLSNFGGAYENINLKSMVSLRGFAMEESGLIHVPEDIRYVAASLRVLDLRNNKISTLDNMHDIPFPSLREVWLQFNNICHLRPKLLRLPILQSFSIANNKITELPNLSSCVWGMETEHATFALFFPANNPFYCNGSMMWLGKAVCRIGNEVYFRRLMLTIALENLFCHSPTEVQGRPVVPVDELNIDEMERCGEFYHSLCLGMPFCLQDKILYVNHE